MGKTFSKNEHKIAETLSVGTVFYFKGEKLTVLRVAKPTVASGECKTDIYIEAEDNHSKKYEFKISYKQENAKFIENKMKAEIAEELLGSDWMKIIKSGTTQIKKEFECRPIIIKKGRFNGSITLGWKYELLDVKSGKLSTKLKLTKNESSIMKLATSPCLKIFVLLSFSKPVISFDNRLETIRLSSQG